MGRLSTPRFCKSGIAADGENKAGTYMFGPQRIYDPEKKCKSSFRGGRANRGFRRRKTTNNNEQEESLEIRRRENEV